MASIGEVLPANGTSHGPESHHMDDLSRLGDRQALGLHLMSLLLSAISLIVTSTALYLFIKSRRSFRHDLIMLLIMSDALKSLWFFIFPLLTIIQGPLSSSSVLCQVSGFFLSLGIEASDVAVLLIATHAFLSVLHPAATGGPSNGIHPYRYYAYSAFVIFPVIVASMAFLDKPLGYLNTGEFCYLPSHPTWPSLFLSWIPRLITFIGIFALYLFIYTHVRGVMRTYEKTSLRHNHAKAAFLSQFSGLDAYQLDAVRPLSPIAYHGLIPNSRRPSSMDGRSRIGSEASIMSPPETTSDSVAFANPFHGNLGSRGIQQYASHMIRFNIPDFGRPENCESYHVRLNSEPENVAPELLVSTPSNDPPPPSPFRYEETDPLTTPQSPFPPSLTSLSTTLPVRPGPSPLTSTDGLTRGQSFTSAVCSVLRGSYSSASTLLNSPALEPPAFGLRSSADLAKTRTRVFRQLRLLFIYPIVYVGIWVLPFITSMMRLREGTIESSNDNSGVGSPSAPFGLVIASMVSLCIQGAVDAGLFLAREKPWREKTSGGWWGRDVSQQAVGRTREEMLIDGKIARRRRRQEVEERRAMVKAKARVRGSRNWWDVEDIEEMGMGRQDNAI